MQGSDGRREGEEGGSRSEKIREHERDSNTDRGSECPVKISRSTAARNDKRGVEREGNAVAVAAEGERERERNHLNFASTLHTLFSILVV